MNLKVGDTVEATKDWWRVDRTAKLHAHQTAKVVEVYQVDANSPQIISVEFTDAHGRRCIMGSMVCLENVPLRKPWPPTTLPA